MHPEFWLGNIRKNGHLKDQKGDKRIVSRAEIDFKDTR